MTLTLDTPCIAFRGNRRITRGSLEDVALALRSRRPDDGAHDDFVVFDARSSARIDLDLRGTEQDVLARLETSIGGGASTKRRGPGRPRLGVVSREVTLLPRHWAWLCEQPGGASATLRKLVDRARRETDGSARTAQDGAYRFMTAMAGNEPGYEEALRALYRGDREAFEAAIEGWPPDVRDHSRELAGPALSPTPADAESDVESRPQEHTP